MKQKIIHSFQEFFRSGQTGGFLLFFCVIVSLLVANSPAGTAFSGLLERRIGADLAGISLTYPVLTWINDGLMAIFFLLVGLEIKREILQGELSSFRKAAMPVFAALGGMVFPAVIFALINFHTPTRSGWGIPMATDIAFTLAVIGLLGNKAPASLKIFIAALAIADDLGAILVIAFFYTKELHFDSLLYAGGVLALLTLMNLCGVKKLVFYLIPGLVLWYFIHHSGIHATIAGVLLALAIPAQLAQGPSPLQKLEHALHQPVNYGIMPLFALANTNIRWESDMLPALTSPLGLGIMAGLFLGKPLGVSLFSWIAVRLKLGVLPAQANWKHIIGAGLLAGIGFTMSVFISLLSLETPGDQLEAKFAILLTSLLAGLAGYFFLRSTGNKPVTPL